MNYYKTVFLFLASIIMFGCDHSSNIEERIQFQDKNLEALFVDRLKKNEIEYQVKDDAIYYKLFDKDKVDKIFDDAVANRPLKYKIYDIARNKHFLEKLNEAGVEYTLENTGSDIKGVYVKKEYRNIADQLFEDIRNNYQ